jgi:hypothetical protein
MTDAQWKVEAKRISTNANYKLRKFRKECVTQGIVEFVRDLDPYEMKYRGHFVCYLYGHGEESLKLLAVWNTIKIAEETIEKIEGVKHEGK